MFSVQLKEARANPIAGLGENPKISNLCAKLLNLASNRASELIKYISGLFLNPYVKGCERSYSFVLGHFV